MGDQYIGEIRIVGFPFAPTGWALCNGQQVTIQQNQALYTLLGLQFGGDGKTYFNLPNLQGRVPLHAGAGPGLPTYAFGQNGGAPSVTLTQAQMPAHTHAATFTPTSGGTGTVTVTANGSSSLGTTSSPSGNYIAGAPQSSSHAGNFVAAPATNTLAPLAGFSGTIAGLNLSGTVVNSITGGSMPVNTEPPYLALYFIIALEGVYPTRG